MELFDLALIAIAATIAGIAAEAAKQAGMPGKYAGILAVGVGAIAGPTAHIAGLSADGTNTAAALLAGIIGGATAAGLFSGIKAATGGYDGLGDRPEDERARRAAGYRPADRPIQPPADDAD